MKNKSNLIATNSKFDKEILNNFNSFSIDDSSVLKKMKESLSIKDNFPSPFPIPLYDFLCSDITSSDFPSIEFQESCVNKSVQEIILTLEQEFNIWKDKLSKLPMTEGDLIFGLKKMEEYIEKHKNSVFRPEFIVRYQSYKDYPIDGQIQKLNRSTDILKEYINSETDFELKRVYMHYFDEIKKTIDTNYIFSTELPTPKNVITTVTLKDFFIKEIDDIIINDIQTTFCEYVGKRIAILIYLLQTEFKIIEISPNSKTHSRKHFICLLKNVSQIKTQSIDKIFNSWDNGISVSSTDNDYIQIQKKLNEIISNKNT